MSDYALTLFGRSELRVEGGQRAKIAKFTDNPSFFQAYAEIAEDSRSSSSWRQALLRLCGLFPEEAQSGHKRWGERAI